MNDDMTPNQGEIHPLSRKFLWLANPTVKNRFVWVSVIGLIITVLLSFVFPNKHPGPWEPGLLSVISYGVIGAGAYTIVVLSAAPLFNLLSRDEDYYGEGDTDAHNSRHIGEQDHNV